MLGRLNHRMYWDYSQEILPVEPSQSFPLSTSPGYLNAKKYQRREGKEGGQYWTPIAPAKGSIFHAGSHSSLNSRNALPNTILMTDGLARKLAIIPNHDVGFHFVNSSFVPL